MLLPNSSFLIQSFLLLGCHTARSNFTFLFCLFVCFLMLVFVVVVVVAIVWFLLILPIGFSPLLLYFVLFWCTDFLGLSVDEILPDLILLSQFFGVFLTCPFCTPLNSLRNSFFGGNKKISQAELILSYIPHSSIAYISKNP